MNDYYGNIGVEFTLSVNPDYPVTADSPESVASLVGNVVKELLELWTGGSLYIQHRREGREHTDPETGVLTVQPETVEYRPYMAWPVNSTAGLNNVDTDDMEEAEATYRVEVDFTAEFSGTVTVLIEDAEDEDDARRKAEALVEDQYSMDDLEYCGEDLETYDFGVSGTSIRRVGRE